MNLTNTTVEDDGVELVWQVVPCLLLIVGTIGNILSLVVLCRKSLRKSRLSRYLICLSAADLLVLYTGLLPLTIFYMGGVDIRTKSSFLCKVLPWMLYFSLDMSAWIMVSATVERCISVWKPHKVKVICTNKITFINLIVICVILLLVNCHFLIGFHLIEDDDGVKCSTRNNSVYEDFQEKIFTWIDLFLFCIGPFLCQLAGNTAIVVGLVRHSKTLAKYSMGSDGQGGKKDRVISSMTIMLLVLNVMYLACTLPISVYFVEAAIWEPEYTAERGLYYNVANFLYYVNTSSNFIAYIISGRRFRMELLAMVRGRKLTPSNTMILSRASMSNSQNLGSSINSVYSVTGQVGLNP